MQITNGKNLKLSCNVVYPEASYVDTLWLFNGSGKQTNFKYEVNDARFRKCTEGTIKSRNISLTIYNAGLNDSGQYSCVLNISRGLRLKNVSVQAIPDAIGKFLLSLYLLSGVGCLEPIDDSSPYIANSLFPEHIFVSLGGLRNSFLECQLISSI